MCTNVCQQQHTSQQRCGKASPKRRLTAITPWYWQAVCNGKVICWTVLCLNTLNVQRQNEFCMHSEFFGHIRHIPHDRFGGPPTVPIGGAWPPTVPVCGPTCVSRWGMATRRSAVCHCQHKYVAMATQPPQPDRIVEPLQVQAFPALDGTSSSSDDESSDDGEAAAVGYQPVPATGRGPAGRGRCPATGHGGVGSGFGLDLW